jgi:uncharacterized protein YpuA (DUF1002 family)
MAQQSQVWWSFPGGIGWPVGIPLSGGKRSGKKTRKARKSRKATRRMRGGNTITNMLKTKVAKMMNTLKNKNNDYTKAMNQLQGLREKLSKVPKSSAAALVLQQQINNFKLPKSNANLYK